VAFARCVRWQADESVVCDGQCQHGAREKGVQRLPGDRAVFGFRVGQRWAVWRVGRVVRRGAPEAGEGKP